MKDWGKLTVLGLLGLGLGSASITPADADPANLSCSGILHVYRPERFDASVAATTTTVDLAARKITTPLGVYRITSIHEAGIMFGADPSPDFNFVTFGSLDRSTGKMLLNFMTSEQHARLLANEAAQSARAAEFDCVAAQRLF
ncbi:hypothetical protein [Bradyrhizobium diazoefficiens]|uniref:hypothetical protein n=1 Tax=Bradyrhizobium diazoefficiens TaxID=1355477 RepID=UPI0012FEBFB8|nr:hypothetical protein [Bradyrhizobium diazoefficiens]